VYTNLNYIRPGKSVKKQVMKALGYMEHRSGKEGEHIDRTLFGHGGSLTEEQAAQMISEAPTNTYYWRLKISPDLKTENRGEKLDLWALTKKIVEFLEQRLGRENIPFVGAEHRDHTRIPHVHAILLIQRHGREILIDKATLEAVRQFATEQALAQQEARQASRPFSPERRVRQKKRIQPLVGSVGGKAKARRVAGTRRPYIGPPCPKCPGKQPMWKDGLGKRFCPACGFRWREQRRELGVEASR
jgi:Zn ribbon nucleic-acid-binding protein